MIFRLFPNPNSGVFDIQISFDKIESGIMTIFDAIGREVWTQDFSTNKIDEHLYLGEILACPSTYFLVVKTKDQEFVKEMVVY